MNEGEIFEALRVRYRSPQYALLPQVRNGTGYAARVTRTADAIAFNLWPSRGLTISGFEFKSRRGDWLSELRDPEKSGEIQKFCDEWWIVVPREDPPIVQDGELPPTWGLIEIMPNKLPRVKKAAPLLHAEPLTKVFIASVMRSLEGFTFSKESLEAARKRGYEEGIKRHEETDGLQIERLKRELEEVRKNISEFQNASGVQLRWDGERIGNALRLFMDQGECKRMTDRLHDLHNTATSIVGSIEGSLRDLDGDKK